MAQFIGHGPESPFSFSVVITEKYSDGSVHSDERGPSTVDRTMSAVGLEEKMQRLAEKNCTWCGSAATDKCAACRSASYCGQDCQKEDWNYHKKICRAFKNLRPRPSPQHRLTLVLREQESPPILQWMHTNGVAISHETMAARFHGLYGRSWIGKNFRTNKDISPHLVVYFEEDGCRDPRVKRNASLDAATLGESPHHVRGAMVVRRDAGEDGGIGEFADVTAGTYRHFLDSIVHCAKPRVPLR